MGCDIHCHVEFKYQDQWCHWSSPDVGRNYTLFAKMAGVRNYEEIPPLISPRGLPDDITLPTQLDYTRDDYHDASWLTCEEVQQLVEWDDQTHKREWLDPNRLENMLNYFYGNSFWEVKDYPNSFPEGITDARLVFWFDN